MTVVRAWLLLLLLSPASASAELLRLVADPWPPFNDQRLPGKGLASDLVEQALASLPVMWKCPGSVLCQGSSAGITTC